MAQTKAVAKPKATPKTPAKVETGTDVLIQLALEKDLDVEKLEKLIDMKNREQDRQARLDFDLHFSTMQQEMVPVIRDKAAYDNDGKLMYAYASIQAILKLVGPIMALHGFSYRWEEERLDVEPPEKRIHCIISGWGWEKRTYVDIPFESHGKITNNTQMRGVATTYGKRYSFCSAVGIVIEDDDDAGSFTADDLDKYRDYIIQIEDCKTREELQTVFRQIYKVDLADDDAGRKMVNSAWDKRRKELMTPDVDPNVGDQVPPKPPKVIGTNPVDKLKDLAKEAEDAETVTEQFDKVIDKEAQELQDDLPIF